MNFIEKCAAFLKNSDEAKLLKFQSGVTKYLKDQIKSVASRMEDNTELIAEKTEELGEYLVNLDYEQIKNLEDRKEYIKVYVAGYDKLVKELDELKAGIVKDEKIVEKRNAMIEAIK